jgi:hypothetical protein
MEEVVDPRPQAQTVDPDPFIIGLGIFSAIAGAGAFLEARRLRETAEAHQQQQFRTAWFACRRTLIFLRRSVDEFETYMLEDGFGRTAFRIGAIRLTVDFGRRRQLRRLSAQLLNTAGFMTDNVDDLSEFLGPADQERVDGILTRLGEIVMPATYRDLIRLAREVTDLFTVFLDDIGDREDFPSSENNA